MAEERGTLLGRLLGSWATKSLLVGAVATAIDIAVGSLLVYLGDSSTRTGAMAGVLVGSLFTFLANRYYAFRGVTVGFWRPLLRFFLVTAVAMVAHGQVVVWLRDDLAVPFVLAKMLADVAIFTFGQLLLLRYVVFPRHAPAPTSSP